MGSDIYKKRVSESVWVYIKKKGIVFKVSIKSDVPTNSIKSN